MKRKLVIIALALAVILVAGLGFASFANRQNEGTDVETQTYNFLIEKGFNPIQASGVLASIKQNSNFDCTVTSYHTGRCYGLFQWTGPRLENLVEFALENDKMVCEHETQILFVLEELNPESEYYIGDFPYKGFEWNQFWEAQTPSQAAKAFNMVYSRPVCNSNAIGDWAEEIHKQYN